MDEGIRTAAISMTARMRENEILAHNAVNVNTSYFKENLQYYIQDESGRLATKRVINHAPGGLKPGGNMDIALSSGSFIKLKNDDGSVFYSRGGRLSVNENGMLVCGNSAVLDVNNREIYLNGSSNVSITSGGHVMQGGDEEARIMVVKPVESGAVNQIGGNIYEIKGEVKIVNDTSPVISGFTEDSNVDKGNLMTKMINAMRMYEAGQKAILSNDDAVSKAISEFSKF